MKRQVVSFSLWLAVWGVTGCDDAASTVDAGPDAAAPTRMCRAGIGWAPGSPAFVERTDAWGLDGLHGSSLAVGDLDGDGWADLVLSHGSPYDRTPGQVFFNRDAGGGRRFEPNDATGLYQVRGSSEDGRSVSFVRFGDVDGDGDLDAFTAIFSYLTDPSRAPLDDLSEVLLNDGTGSFSLGPAAAVVQIPYPLTSDGFFFDHDLDGTLDLALGYWWEQPAFRLPYGTQPQLFHGDGTGRFTDVTEAAGMILERSATAVTEGTQPRPLFSFQMCDVDDDGRQDLVGAAYGRMFNELFLADGDVFHEIGATTQVGSDDRRDFSDDVSFRCYCAAHAADAYCAGALPPQNPAYCTGFGRPDGDGRGWIPGSSDQPQSLGGNTFCYACGDFDNDGDLDLYESNIRHPDVGSSSDPSEVLVNDGSGTFTRPGRDAMGLAPPVDLAATEEGGQQDATFDFDNDGRLDLYLAGSPYPHNRGWLFHQRAQGTLQFEPIGADAGFDHACANGAALADLDHDGDLDLVVGTYGCNDPNSLPPGESPDYAPPQNQPVRLYENVSNENDFVSIRLVGRGAGGANRFGVGARVRVTAGGVTQTRVLQGSSQNVSFEPEAFFGLGDACDIDRVEIRWPNASLTTQVVTGVLANYRVEITEGVDAPRYLP
jgi:hypothetical protein